MSRLLHKWRPLLAPLLVLLHVGQALAGAAAPCCMQPGKAAASHCQHLQAGHHHAGSGSAQHGAGDCCHGSGACGMAGCFAALALPTSPAHLDALSPDTFAATECEHSPHYLPATLFRPPIPA